eukprot:6181832-Pleurochrysis_carterae.AAC.2
MGTVVTRCKSSLCLATSAAAEGASRVHPPRALQLARPQQAATEARDQPPGQPQDALSLKLVPGAAKRIRIRVHDVYLESRGLYMSQEVLNEMLHAAMNMGWWDWEPMATRTAITRNATQCDFRGQCALSAFIYVHYGQQM